MDPSLFVWKHQELWGINYETNSFKGFVFHSVYNRESKEAMAWTSVGCWQGPSDAFANIWELIVYAGVRTPELTVIRIIGYHLG